MPACWCGLPCAYRGPFLSQSPVLGFLGTFDALRSAAALLDTDGQTLREQLPNRSKSASAKRGIVRRMGLERYVRSSLRLP
jgi:hypothetical protein